MSIGQLLPAELVERLLATPAANLASLPLGSTWLLFKVPHEQGELDLVPPLLRCALREQERPGPIASTSEMPAVSRIPSADGASSEGDQIQLIAELGSVRHVAVPLIVRLDQRVVLGRSESAQIRTVDPSVSGKHAAFAWEDGALTVTDLGSKNGTKHNDVLVPAGERKWLQPMDRLQFGRVESFLCDPRALRAMLLSEQRTARMAAEV